jgi:hypothetical protein
VHVDAGYQDATVEIDMDAAAVVVVAEDAGFGATTVRTLRAIASAELRKRGVPTIDDTRIEGVSPIVPELLRTVVDAGAARLFVLRLGRLDQKAPLSLEEIDPNDGASVFIASHTALSIDEADTVVERLVAAVLAREPFASTARVRSVTAQESRPFQKKPGEGFWVVGLGLAPLGGSFGWSYEAERWRLGAFLQGGENEVTYLGIDGAWIAGDRDVAPYVGLGLGVVVINDSSVLGTKLEVGFEFFRLHGVRLLAGANAIIPFGGSGDIVNPGLHLRFCF